jgi:molecular chaperone DnaJ
VAPQREWFEKDYYAELGVASDATDKDITRAYRKLAKQYHPDANPGDARAEEHFKAISAAYDVLSDPAKRKEYDEVRQMVASGVGPGGFRDMNGFAGFGTGPRGAQSIRFEDLDDDASFADLFSSLLGGGFRGAGARARNVPRKGRDLETAIHIDFVDAVRGVLVPVRFAAGGESREVKVRIPAGVDDGHRLRVPGRGLEGSNGGPPGDLYVRVNVRPHPQFGRDGRNLTVTLPVTYPEAVLGAQITVPTLDEPVTIKVPAGTPSGKVLRVRGRGVENAKGGKGDLLVTVEVAVPHRLSGDEKKAVEVLAETMDWNPRSHWEVGSNG